MVDCGGPATRIVIEAKQHGKELPVDIVRGIANAWLGVPDEEGPYFAEPWVRCIVSKNGFQPGCAAIAGASKICFFQLDDGDDKKLKLTAINPLAEKLQPIWEKRGRDMWKMLDLKDLEPRAKGTVAAAAVESSGAVAAEKADGAEVAAVAAAAEGGGGVAASRKRKSEAAAPFTCSLCRKAGRPSLDHKTAAKCPYK